MRVIAGKAKGRKLRTVPGEGVRPITDRVKESLFNIIGADIAGSVFLDLFAGTGSVGIEALSRGAGRALFVERDRRALQIVKTNLAATGLGELAEVRHADAFHLLAAGPAHACDYVYIAPPQYQGLWTRALQLVDQHPGWLSDDAWLIAQIHPVEYQDLELSNVQEFDRRKYGSTLLVFYQRRLDDIPQDEPLR